MFSSILSGNAVGRAYSLWLCGRELGWEMKVIGRSDGPLWTPLQETKFAADCITVADDATGLRTATDLSLWADLMLAVKPLPESFGVASRIQRSTHRPLILDIDDGDIDELERRLQRKRLWRFGISGPRSIQTGHHRVQLARLRASIRAATVTCSNPVLQKKYGGWVVPHVREIGPPGTAHTRTKPVVAFIGTPGRHKGIDLLRAAIEGLASSGYSLVVTASTDRPQMPWERWIGQTSLEEGSRLLADADIVALPSLATPYARVQLPVKLIDAMLAARAVVASNLPANAWALGDTGILITPGSVRELADALLQLKDPARRAELGERARRRALDKFVPEVAASSLMRAATHALSRVSRVH